MKQVLLIVMITSLAGCGGFHKAKRSSPKPAAQAVFTPAPAAPRSPSTSSVAAAPTTSGVPFARGPINSACMSSKRKARSRSLCGCIQAVANDTLSSSQQRLAVSFYSDPHKAQEIRQSDRPNHEKFWEDYRAYGRAAERTCR